MNERVQGRHAFLEEPTAPEETLLGDVVFHREVRLWSQLRDEIREEFAPRG